MYEKGKIETTRMIENVICEIMVGEGRSYKGDIKVEKKYFIEKVSKRISSGKCELFIGSGISSQSNLPSWSELLAPLASDIGIELNEADELPLIAQYIVNNVAPLSA